MEPATAGAEHGFRYKAFISYRHAEPDRRVAQWLHASFEGYRTPQYLVEQGIPAHLGKVFRDEEELAASPSLSSEIDAALKQSEFLIVVCSPRTPQSEWINREVQVFRELGRSQKILASLIEGEPSTSFPSSLYSIRRQTGLGSVGSVDHSVEPLAADFRLLNGMGKSSTWRIAKLKLLSTILGCRFDDLMMREQARRRRQLIAAFGGLVGVLILILSFAVIAVVQRGVAQTERAAAIVQRDAALLTQSRFLTDLSRQQTTSGNTSLGMMLVLEALPRDFSARDRPYLPQAMAALYSAVVAHREVLTVILSEEANVDPESHRYWTGS